jgi:transposase
VCFLKPLPAHPTYKVKAARQFAANALDSLNFSINEIAEVLSVSEATVRRDTANTQRHKRRSPRQSSCFAIDEIRLAVIGKLTEAGFDRATIAALFGISSRTVYRGEKKITATMASIAEKLENDARSYRADTIHSQNWRSRRYKKPNYSQDE